MKVEFGVLKPLAVDDKRPPIEGSFTAPVPFNWVKCREQFAGSFTDKLTEFFFSHPIGAGIHVAAFISKTEDIMSLSVPMPQRSEFCLTNRPYALWVSPSPFWRNCPIRRSLFTILLRCGFEYREAENNYEDALYSDPYIKDTKLAVHRFLFGYTQFVNRDNLPVNSGWRDFFRNQNREMVIKCLDLGEKIKFERSMLGLGTIWN